jgi:hypothetical protein
MPSSTRTDPSAPFVKKIQKRPLVAWSAANAIESSPRSPTVLVAFAPRSRNGVGSVAPFSTTRTVPARSTTKTRVASPGGAVTNVGAAKSPTCTSWTPARAGVAPVSRASAAASAIAAIRPRPWRLTTRWPSGRGPAA